MPDINYGDYVAVQTTHLTPREINQRNREFWEEQNALRAARMSNPAIRQVAFLELESERWRLPVYFQKTVEKALEDAERATILFHSEFSRTGGRAPKPDALEQFIEDLVQKRPFVTQSKLLELLKENHAFDIEDDQIFFAKPNGAQKSVNLSALKDRLCRAKKKCNSR
jgi:hypothetical protein